MNTRCECQKPLIARVPASTKRFCVKCNGTIGLKMRSVQGTTRNDFNPRIVLARLDIGIQEPNECKRMLEEACHRIVVLETRLEESLEAGTQALRVLAGG